MTQQVEKTEIQLTQESVGAFPGKQSFSFQHIMDMRLGDADSSRQAAFRNLAGLQGLIQMMN
jgi:hypothetical protein